MEKIVIFGASGRTGICAVEVAVEKGLKVRAFVRNPSKFPETLKSKVERIHGDVLEYDHVSKAIKGVSAVVVLGTKSASEPNTPQSEGTKNIIKAMKEHGVDIISICLSAFLFWEPKDVPTKFHEWTADYRRKLNILKESNLKYIAVLPYYILDQAGNRYCVQENKCPGDLISKYALGKFLVECLSIPEYYGKMYGISNERQ